LILIISLRRIRDPVIGSRSKVSIQHERASFTNGCVMKIQVFVSTIVYLHGIDDLAQSIDCNKSPVVALVFHREHAIR